jgi:hypothetical protein
MSAHNLNAAVWRKSSRSNGNGGSNCVEVADLGDAVAVRDSKDPQGPALVFASNQWDAFVDRAKEGGFDSAA